MLEHLGQEAAFNLLAAGDLDCGAEERESGGSALVGLAVEPVDN